ncbi:MAG: SDR family NAD(P)-dependent oxidoreductase [Burkholderiales bacterium]
MKLQAKVAVITGAASGVGRATSLAFAREGATVVCVDVDDVLGPETAELIEREGGTAEFIHADVAQGTEVSEMARRCMERHGRVHVLFNNAGVLTRASFEELELEDWNRVIAVNLTGPYLCSARLLPALKAAGGASIIHHGSIDGALGNPTAVSYSVSKGGLIPLTHVMAHALAKYGIRVNCINSGGLLASRQGIPVRLMPELRGGAVNTLNARTKATPLGRPGYIEECASVALFLASDDASFMTGSVMTLDGGRTGITPGTG